MDRFSILIFFNGFSEDVEVESVFSVSTASSLWVGLVLIFFNGFSGEVEAESVFSVSTASSCWVGLVLFSLMGLQKM